LCITGFLAPLDARAGDFSLHGFAQGNYSYALESNPDGRHFKWAEERVQIKLDGSKGAFHGFLKADAFYDHVDPGAGLELREAFLDYGGGAWDLRIGRQMVTWGVGDLLFINDVFPKDYEAFFSGRPLEYLKKGVDGAKVGLYPGFASFELLILSNFEPDTFPDPKRFWIFDPSAGAAMEETRPAGTIGNAEIALRVYRDVGGFDASAYFYKGFFRQPSPLQGSPSPEATMTLVYPELSVYGASLQGRALDGVLSLEAGYYDSREDRDGEIYAVPNSQIRFLVGYQKQLWEDFTMGLQFYGEAMRAYSAYRETVPLGFPLQERSRRLVTLRLTQLMARQTLTLNLFAFYSPSAGDHMANAEAKYRFSDHAWAAVGVNVFGGGDPWSPFGQLGKNDNLYCQVRVEF
jgi:hypothetical protein